MYLESTRDTARTHAKLLQTLCDPMDLSPLESSVHHILQVRTMEWVAVPSSGGYSPPKDQTPITYV